MFFIVQVLFVFPNQQYQCTEDNCLHGIFYSLIWMIFCTFCLCLFDVGSIIDINESCALSILSNLLVDGEKSPFYQSLLESGIGSDYGPTTGFVDVHVISSWVIRGRKLEYVCKHFWSFLNLIAAVKHMQHRSRNSRSHYHMLSRLWYVSLGILLELMLRILFSC